MVPIPSYPNHSVTISGFLSSDTSFWADVGGSSLEDVAQIIRACELHPLTIEDILR